MSFAQRCASTLLGIAVPFSCIGLRNAQMLFSRWHMRITLTNSGVEWYGKAHLIRALVLYCCTLHQQGSQCSLPQGP